MNSYQLSVIGYQLSVIGYRLSAVVLFLLLTGNCLLITVKANGGDDHSHGDEPKATGSAPSATISIVSAERNINNEAGNFTLLLKRSPGDVRTNETAQFLLKITEKVEGGFGAGGAVALEKATVTAGITQANGAKVAENLPVKADADGNYRTSYAFSGAGDYKIVFAVTTPDKRTITADFPVSVGRAPINFPFWLTTAVLSAFLLMSIGTIFYAARRKGAINFARIALPSFAALLIFAFGIVASAYLLPPSERRSTAEIPLNATTETPTNALANKTFLTVPKESQLLFGIKTEPIGERQITGGLKVSGIVKSRPDAKAVISPPTAGKILLKQGLTIGSVVGRGEQVGTVEQILDIDRQATLESQRVDAETRKREVQARNLELETQRIALQTAVVELNGKINEQKNLALQARTRLAQAQREQQRAENLVAVDAVPRKRLEEAQTAVKVVEQEVSGIEDQIKTLSNQVLLTKTSANKLDVRFDAVNPVAPRRNLPITSPITGVITEVRATSGQQIEAATEIFTVVNLTAVLLEAQVFEGDLGKVRSSSKASFTAPSLDNEVYTIGTADGDGRLLSVGQSVNPETRNFAVIYEIKNPSQRLREGMFVEINIDTQSNEKVAAVPKNAVVSENGETFVFVFGGGETFEKRKIAVGAEGADFYEIKSGLKIEERVVTEGIYQLRSTPAS